MKLSIVVPCYNEELNIPTFYSEVTKLEKDLRAHYLNLYS